MIIVKSINFSKEDIEFSYSTIYDSSYKYGIELGKRTLEEINENKEEYYEYLKNTFINMLDEENEPCGGSFDFNAWWEGFFTTIEKEYPKTGKKLRRLKKAYNKGESIYI